MVNVIDASPLRMCTIGIIRIKQPRYELKTDKKVQGETYRYPRHHSSTSCWHTWIGLRMFPAVLLLSWILLPSTKRPL